jgi:transposase InsO family protein
MGTRKLLTILQPLLREHHIKMGRDALFTALSSNHLLVRKRKRRIQTTQSFHWLRKYPNLIKDFVPSGINQLWVSDITYWKVNNTHLYLNFITDAFSHKIVGYNLGETLESVESLQALRMALSALGVESHTQLIHHSDRGLQYCSHSYVELLNKHGIQISMTEDGNPRENAIAERLNGIMKGEYLENYKFTSMIQAKQLIQSKVDLYNHERPHMSISNLTPSQIHKPGQTVQTKRLWKNYYPKPPIVNL